MFEFFHFIEDMEGFARGIRAIYIVGIENIAKFLTGKAINTYLFKPGPKSFPPSPPHNFFYSHVRMCALFNILWNTSVFSVEK